MEVFESVPNFSEGRRADVIADLVDASRRAHFLDGDADADHNRYVLTLAGTREKLIDALVSCVGTAVEKIDLREHAGVHPRVGAADVVPIVPLGDVTLDSAREVAHELGQRIWETLRVPVYFYGHAEGRRLAEIRSGRVAPDIGGPALHPSAGAVSVGARPYLVAFNVILYGYDLVAARGLARSIRETGGGLRGVQALAFQLSGDRVQLSMNLFRLDETTPVHVMAELERRGVSYGAQQIVGLCPAFAANEAASGRVLEGRLAAKAAAAGAGHTRRMADVEYRALASRLMRTADSLLGLEVDQDALLAAAEQAAALVPVLRAARVLDEEVETLLRIAARGLRRAITPATEAIYRARLDALDVRLT